MSLTVDFRTLPFHASKIDSSGKDIANKVYWKLYAIENLVRVVIHSVLMAQIGAGWWHIAADNTIRKGAQRFKSKYSNQPWYSMPGAHDIYYTHLSDLNEIIRANSNLFLPVIGDIDQWIARIEQIKLPRNIVGHMNWPNSTDRERINVIYSDMHALIRYMSNSGVTLTIP